MQVNCPFPGPLAKETKDALFTGISGLNSKQSLPMFDFIRNIVNY